MDKFQLPPQAIFLQPPTLTVPFTVLASCLALAAVALPAPSTPTLHPPPDEEAAGPDYWMAAGRQDINDASAVAAETRQTAKNVVLFIGDGMGISTVTAARILKGQLENRSGEEGYLAFERFSHLGLAKTYSTNQQTAESAGTATALLTGVKTLSGMVGVSDTAQRGNCSSMAEAQKLTSFLKLAADAGRATGIVTTTRLTHATPAAAYSHSVERKWEDDSDRNAGVKDVDLRSRCPDIAQQFVDNAANFRVALGGGRQKFQPRRSSSSRYRDPTTGQTYKGGRRDGVDLISKWKSGQSRAGRKCAYVETSSQLEAVSAREVDSVLGLMAPSHLDFHEDNQRKASEAKRQPSLARMTTKAVELLSVYGQSSGFVLLVEGGRIDNGHHLNQANRALYETVSLSEAVEATVDLLRQLEILNDTLMMVTADHSHVFTLGHYGARGQPITQLKYAKRGQSDEQLLPERAEDGLPLTVVNYADGPGAYKSRGERWENLSDGEEPEDTTASEYQFPAMIQRNDESHGGEDVPIYAQGPGAHLIHRVHEQSYVAHVIMKAARLGPYAVDDAEEP